MIRFTRDQLRAIAGAGRLTDPRATDYLVDTLVARQRATAKYWFDRVAPLDGFAITPAGLCFEDLALVYGLAGPVATSYTITTYDHAGRPLGARVVAHPAQPRTCTGAISAGSDREGYTMVRIDVRRPGTQIGVVVHLARDPATGSPRVIGLWRL